MILPENSVDSPSEKTLDSGLLFYLEFYIEKIISCSVSSSYGLAGRV